MIIMKKDWSPKWLSSCQPRKQRKYVLNAPLHARRKLVSVNLSKPLRERFGKRSMPVRKGDEVVVMRGNLRGKTGSVDRVSLAKSRIYVEGLKRKKVDGSDVSLALVPSNLQITKMVLEDKARQEVLEKAGTKPAKKKTAGKKAEVSSKKIKAPKTKGKGE